MSPLIAKTCQVTSATWWSSRPLLTIILHISEEVTIDNTNDNLNFKVAAIIVTHQLLAAYAVLFDNMPKKFEQTLGRNGSRSWLHTKETFPWDMKCQQLTSYLNLF